MTIFAAKATPTSDKLRGGYYTPQPIAQFLAEWVTAAGPRVLEPSCGDGAILRELVRTHGRDSVTAVELIPGEARKASNASGVRVEAADFFEWFGARERGSFDSVAGNPPYIRFGSWDESSRERALTLMRRQGLHPTRLTNAWVPFVVASVVAVRPGGRIALVLPAELLQVGYAAELRSYLVDQCSRVTVLSFQRLVFPGILQEVVLLLAERGSGPAEIRMVEIPDASHLHRFHDSAHPAPRAHLHESEKWTKYYLDAASIPLLRSVRIDGRLRPLEQYAEVDVGVVTGRNSFFCLSDADAQRRKLSQFTMPLVARSMQVPGLSFTESDFTEQRESDARTHLLALPPDIRLDHQPALATYLAEGEAAGVPEGYKCRIRRNWWAVPSTWVPDGFMLRQISTHPRLIANMVGATSTDTVHRLRVAEGVDMKRLATGAFNSVTFALAEVLGRSYGGGILELEPSECGHLPVADPELVPLTLHHRVDELVRSRRVYEAIDLVDQEVLIDTLGFDIEEVAELRRAWERLRDRRMSRSKRRPSGMPLKE